MKSKALIAGLFILFLVVALAVSSVFIIYKTAQDFDRLVYEAFEHSDFASLALFKEEYDSMDLLTKQFVKSAPILDIPHQKGITGKKNSRRNGSHFIEEIIT